MVPRQPWETAMGRDFAGRCGQWGVLGEGQGLRAAVLAPAPALAS